jgi:hypothetical protein
MKRIVYCLTCKQEYIVDHMGPLKSYENCPNDDCDGRTFRAVRKAERKK